MTVFVTNLYKGGVPRSKSLQNDIKRRKTPIIHLIQMITFLESSHSERIPIKGTIPRDRQIEENNSHHHYAPLH